MTCTAGVVTGRQRSGQPSSDTELLDIIQSRPQHDPERQAASDELVRRYDNIVRACVNRYRDTPEPAEDLMQVGYVGLMKAINNYDPAIGESLAAYAQPCVSGEIKRHFRDKRWQMRVHRSAQELRLRLRSASPRLAQQLAHSPSVAELARYLEVTEAEIMDAELASQVLQVSSLEAPVDADDLSLGDRVGAEDANLEHALNMQAVWQHCAELPAREQRLLMMRFYGNMTQAEIGERLGVSQMHVSRLLKRSLSYIRERITEPGDQPAQ
jgi:RNA polymerase sigma-B factor